MEGTQHTTEPFVTCQGAKYTAAPFVTEAATLSSHARYTTDSCTFCDMQGAQQTDAKFIICQVQSRLLRLYHLQGSQHTAGNLAR
jgi:hypothetical protein